MEKIYKYYENGYEEIFTRNEMEKIFDTDVDEEQKKAGTTFETWLFEMKKMGIYTEEEKMTLPEIYKELEFTEKRYEEKSFDYNDRATEFMGIDTEEENYLLGMSSAYHTAYSDLQHIMEYFLPYVQKN